VAHSSCTRTHAGLSVPQQPQSLFPLSDSDSPLSRSWLFGCMTHLCEHPHSSSFPFGAYWVTLFPFIHHHFSYSPHLMSDDSIPLDDVDWEVVSDDWWHTPLTTAPCPLSWINPEPHQFRPRTRSEAAARKSHYWHELLLLITKSIQGVGVCCSSCQEWRYIDGGGTFVCDAMKGVGVQGDLDLNLDLVGVKMVRAMVDELERAVGIAMTEHHHTAGEIPTLARRVSQFLGNAQPVVTPEDSWNEYTATVLDGDGDGIAPHGVTIYRPDLNASPPPADSITPILDLDLDPPRRKSPRFSREVIDLTDSEQSVASEAPPATPKPERSFAAGGDGTMPSTLSPFVISLILTCTPSYFPHRRFTEVSPYSSPVISFNLVLFWLSPHFRRVAFRVVTHAMQLTTAW
jgi:hypothetical protein